MISNCGHDERNKYSESQAGDQTSQEWAIIPWYSRPWNVVLRHPDRKVGQKLADLARAAAENNCIGYDQKQRYDYWNALRRADFDPARITELCEADCSSGVAAHVKTTGYLLGIESLKTVSIYTSTHDLRRKLVAAGFQELLSSKYLVSDAYLLPGDILLLEGHHTATNLDTGAKASTEESVSYPCWIKSGTTWYYRLAEGKNAHGWLAINHHWYWFDESGKMATDWREIDGAWYYFQPSGGLEGALYRSDANGAQSIWYVD